MAKAIDCATRMVRSPTMGLWVRVNRRSNSGARNAATGMLWPPFAKGSRAAAARKRATDPRTEPGVPAAGSCRLEVGVRSMSSAIPSSVCAALARACYRALDRAFDDLADDGRLRVPWKGGSLDQKRG